VLGSLILAEFADFITGFAVENKAFHVVAHTDEEVPTGRKPDTIDEVAVLPHALVEFEGRALEVPAPTAPSTQRSSNDQARAHARDLKIIATSCNSKGAGLLEVNAADLLAMPGNFTNTGAAVPHEHAAEHFTAVPYLSSEKKKNNTSKRLPHQQQQCAGCRATKRCP
jgi:hypothetical protein